jgi:hypothetical protein
LDGFPLVFIKLLLPLILPVLTELFNYILTSSTFPFVWKISSVVSIPKVHFPTEKSDYRPFSILHILAKAFENVMYEQMVNNVCHFSLVLDLVIWVSNDICPNSIWSQINQRFLFCLTCHGLFILKLRQRYGGGNIYLYLYYNFLEYHILIFSATGL